MLAPDSIRQRQSVWRLLAAGWVAAAAGLGLWLRTPAPALREQLKIAQFWSLEACLVLLLTLGGIVLRDIWRTLDRVDVRRLVLIAALAVALTTLVAPRTNRIYFDEQIYQSIGQNLSDLRRAQMCNDGTVEYGRLQCWYGEYNKQPYAWPHLLSVAYRIVGVREAVAFALNAVVTALAACAIYLLVVVLFDDRAAAMFAGLIFSLTPQQILWSATAAVEPSASLSCIVVLLSAAWFGMTGRTIALAAAGVAAAYAVQFRPESFLILPALGLLLWPRLREEFDRPRVWGVGLLVLGLLAVHLAHLSAVRNEAWGASGARLSLAYVAENLRVNGLFYLGDERFPAIYTVLAAAGLAARRRARERLAMALYFLAFFSMYLLFYAGSYNYGADVRYSLLTYPPISILAGLGAARAAGWIERAAPRRAVAVIAAGLAIQFLWYAPLVRATTEEAWAARADVAFARRVVPELRGSSYVLTHNPGMFHVWGINAGQISSIVNNPLQLDFLTMRYGPGSVYLHWNYWCNVNDEVQRGFCTKALEDRTVEQVREHRERDQRYRLYRFTGARRGG